MGAGAGIPGVTSALKGMATAATDAAAALKKLQEQQARDREAAYGPTYLSQADLSQAEADRQNATGDAGAGNTSVPGAAGLNPFSADVLDAEGFKAGGYKAANAAAKAYDAQVANDMETFARQIDAAYQKETYIGAGFRQLAQFIREGRFSGADASRYAQAIFANFASGAQREMTDPDSSPIMKALDFEFLTFISSGRLFGGIQ